MRRMVPSKRVPLGEGHGRATRLAAKRILRGSVTRPKICHGKHLEQGDKFAVAYATKYSTAEREFAIRAFRYGWELLFDGCEPTHAWDRATAYAWTNKDTYDFHVTRVDVLAGYNRADEFRQSLRKP